MLRVLLSRSDHGHHLTASSWLDYSDQKNALILRNTIVLRMEILNVKVEEEIKEKLERLVKRRAYKNKSEAVRKMLEEHFNEHPELFASDDLEEITEEADKMTDEQFEKIAAEVFKGPKTAAELVAEGRGR